MTRHLPSATAPVLALAMVSAMPGQAAATADGPDFYRVTGIAPGAMLEIRESSGSAASVLAAIPGDTDGLRNLGCTGQLGYAEWAAASEAERAEARENTWCRVSWKGIEGWVPGRHVAEGDATGDAGIVGHWRLARTATDDRTELIFRLGGELSGSTGCNRFNATARMAGDRLSIGGPIAVTRMACPPPLAEAERVFLAVLEGAPVVSYDPIYDLLTLTAEAGTLVFRR